MLQLIQQTDDLFIAIQCAIQGNISVKLVDSATLQSILRNVTLHLPDGYELIVGTRTENVHRYYQIAKVSVLTTAPCIKLTKHSAESCQSTLHFIQNNYLDRAYNFRQVFQYSVNYPYVYLGVQTSQRDYIQFSEADLSRCSKSYVIVWPANIAVCGEQRPTCKFSVYFQTVSYNQLCKREL
jgi:hypothetical protein